ncbi:MAG: hypothetical protein IPF50_17195 [Proteobacteria bacterium]|nr:hypothetical protein [Pseudomonadota bacterium]
MSAETIMTVANQIFGWDIDFALDLREGDEFSVLYEQKFQDGEYVNDGRVLAAEFVNQGNTHRAVWFQSQDGKCRVTSRPRAKACARPFLRAPLDFTRVSSVFNRAASTRSAASSAPTRGRRLRGVDGHAHLAAGDGASSLPAVRAVAANVVTIDHGKGISTVYGHMSRFGVGGASAP